MQTSGLSSNETEMEWVRECLAGHANAFRPLMERSERMVRGMIMNMIKDSVLAEELAQQSFVTAFERLHQFKGNAKFSTWVCQIALNKCRDYMRRKWPETELYETVLSQHESADSPERELDELQRKHLINEAMSKLKSEDREIVTFKYLCGYPYELIGQILGCSAKTAKVRSFRARENLKTALMGMEIEVSHG